MRVAIVRTAPGLAVSMDVYADRLVAGLRSVRPDWEVVELAPDCLDKSKNFWSAKLGYYHDRFWRYPRRVAREGADLFHIIADQHYHLSYGLKKQGATVVATCHDLIHFAYPENLYQKSNLPFVSMAAWQYSVRGMQKVDHVVAVSSNTAKDAIRTLDISPKQLTVVPVATDAAFRPLPAEGVELFRQKHSVAPGTLCLLNVGTVEPRKNILTVLKVMEALQRRGIPVHLWKTGDDLDPSHKAYLREHGLGEKVTSMGRIDKASLVLAYNAADVLLSPSLYEGFGMTVQEAMACGTPVIASNTSSLPEVAGDAAILLDPMDVEAMSEAACRVHQDAAFRHGLVARGHARVQSMSKESTAEQIARIYTHLVGDKPRAGISGMKA